MPRYCLFGVNVGLTEKFESNSKPMKIHISETCQGLLSGQYKVEERNDEGLKMKVGGYRSFFLNSKDNRRPLQEAVIKALLPTDKEQKTNIKKDDKKGDKKDAAAPAKADAAAPAAPAAAAAPAPSAAAAPTPSAAPEPVASATPPPPPSGGDGGGGEGGADGGDAGGGGGDEASPAAETEDGGGDGEAAEDEPAAEEGEALGVETVSQSQCCAGGLKKSAVCNLI
eukprot:TRINITY_DN48717_c0_g1_i1.p1 TRINITY_DN48717_c0_g1~~TRINITY_DN48717_c0_g1_i1.p1  ORF type:complete len:238 (-),score=98.14 TRINITY_DN48717_c0_g1_i1:59-736(-)